MASPMCLMQKEKSIQPGMVALSQGINLQTIGSENAIFHKGHIKSKGKSTSLNTKLHHRTNVA